MGWVGSCGGRGRSMLEMTSPPPAPPATEVSGSVGILDSDGSIRSRLVDVTAPS